MLTRPDCDPAGARPPGHRLLRVRSVRVRLLGQGKGGGDRTARRGGQRIKCRRRRSGLLQFRDGAGKTGISHIFVPFVLTMFNLIIWCFFLSGRATHSRCRCCISASPLGKGEDAGRNEQGILSHIYFGISPPKKML